MPRQRGGGRAPARPTAAPARNPHPTQPQQRPASTAAHPPATAQQPHPPAQAGQAQGRSPGLFGQMASTAAGVAVGSSIGHAIGGFFGGGSSAAAPEQNSAAETSSSDQYASGNTNYTAAGRCETDVRNFRTCLDQNQGDMTICGWYLDQLKACQAAASPY